MPIWLSVGCLTDGQMKAKGQIKHRCEIVGSVHQPLSNSDGRQRQIWSSQLYQISGQIIIIADLQKMV